MDHRVGQKIQSLRKERGMTQEALAEAAEISVPHLSHIETGSKGAGVETLVRIAAALGVTADRLLAEIQPADKICLLPEVCELLEDCSAAERYVIFETSKALKRAMRERFSA